MSYLGDFSPVPLSDSSLLTMHCDLLHRTESGVEERNRVEHNLAAFVHPINGAQLMASNVIGNTFQSENILVPADHTASGFYVSNVHNYIVGNAASGGWSGIQFPVLPRK